MPTMTLSQLITAASDLSTEQQLALNKALCELIRSNRKVNAAIASGNFQIGDVVRFDAKRKGLKIIKISGWNRARTCAVGHECSHDGTPTPMGVRWTVATTLLSKV